MSSTAASIWRSGVECELGTKSQLGQDLGIEIHLFDFSRISCKFVKRKVPVKIHTD